jgi:hypothetical protein
VNNEESLLITKTNGDGYDILERIPSLPYKVILQNVDAFQIWYDRLGRPGVGMMRKIIGNWIGHNLKEAKFAKTIIYGDNASCVAEMQMGSIKTNYTKYIAPKLFYPHELQEGGEISILQIKSYDNLANLFTKSLLLVIFDKCVKDIGMSRLKDLQDLGGDSL